ncbi:MAG: phospholipid carrier-dependent glycosyltransferase [Epsilonproteobacteria bacterium]|nr:phospholipid carrier-dependent glycosyltransferase [Campylobacterota bacterium]
MKHLWQKHKTLFDHAWIVFLISIFTYTILYFYPSAVFWDENYHIASAQKYIEGIMYMEPHPPLGKLFIALGEFILSPNAGLDTAHFVKTDYISNFPQGYSFAGVRLFPTLFGAAGSVLFFLILYKLSHHIKYAFLFTSMYLFANAFILQSRSAMLESTQMFFIFAAILYFLTIFDKEDKSYKAYLFLGGLIGLAVSVKLNGLILIILFPFLYFYKLPLMEYKKYILDFILKGILFVVGLILSISFVFYIHFNLADQLGNKNYQASTEYKQILKDNATANVQNFPVMMMDHLRYISGYGKKVPQYNPCKEGENGSYALTWPFGNKSINYRWDKYDDHVRYLYLQVNPMIWFSVVISLIITLSLIIAKFIFGLQVTDKRLFYLMGTFMSMYISYMITMVNIERVMYLYHYFIPLFFGTFILFLLFNYLFKESIEKGSKILHIAVIIFVAEIIFCYFYFAPFTYYWSLTTTEFYNRVWFDFWKLEPIL